jgi:hypothetical protein
VIQLQTCRRDRIVANPAMFSRAGALLSSTLSRAGVELKVPSIKEQQAPLCGLRHPGADLLWDGNVPGHSARKRQIHDFSCPTLLALWLRLGAHSCQSRAIASITWLAVRTGTAARDILIQAVKSPSAYPWS